MKYQALFGFLETIQFANVLCYSPVVLSAMCFNEWDFYIYKMYKSPFDQGEWYTT